MKFEELYTIVVESEQQVINENFKNKLKLAALATVFGIQIASLPTLNRLIKRYINRTDPARMEEIYKQIDYEVDHPSTELINSVAKIEQLSEKHTDIPNKQTSRTSFMKKVMRFLTANEGFRNEAYPDVYGYLTIGVGHLIKPTDIKNGLFKDGEYTMDGKGNIIYAKLTDKRVYQLFLHDVESKILKIQNSFPNYEEYPEPLKIAILDGYFRGDLAGSPKTINLIRTSFEKCLEGDIKSAKKLANDAATEFLNNVEYKSSVKNGTGVKGRMERLADFIKYAYDETHSFDYTSSVYK